MKKIIYIEDFEDTAVTVRKVLSKAGFEVDIALSGKEGVKKVLQKHYDLVLLDIMMPDMSGWDIFETLKKKIKNTKYVFLTVLPVSSERMEELKKAGISDYITKPFQNEDLITRIKMVLNKNEE